MVISSLKVISYISSLMVVFLASFILLSLNSADKISAQRLGSQIPTPLMSNGSGVFNIFTTQIPEVNEGTLGVPGDVYSVPVMIVKRGENVTINFYNDDRDAADRHTFTIKEPYNVNKDIATGASAGISFTADKEGLFMYYCTYHPKTMYGTMLVLP